MATSLRTRLYLSQFDKADGSKALLTLRTDKASNGGIYSQASMAFEKDGMLTFEVFGDYSKQIARDKTARATQKALNDMHRASFTIEGIEAIKAEVTAHYAAKAERDGK